MNVKRTGCQNVTGIAEWAWRIAGCLTSCPSLTYSIPGILALCSRSVYLRKRCGFLVDGTGTGHNDDYSHNTHLAGHKQIKYLTKTLRSKRTSHRHESKQLTGRENVHNSWFGRVRESSVVGVENKCPKRAIQTFWIIDHAFSRATG